MLKEHWKEFKEGFYVGGDVDVSIMIAAIYLGLGALALRTLWYLFFGC